jgi:dTDP-4-amino-4,6-dideoxygalactose transaminase
MKVPFVDLKSQYIRIKEEIQKEINEVLDNTAYICGRKVKKFEEDFAEVHQVKYCTALSSGTDALHTALTALGIKHGNEVIVPVNTFIATSEAVTLCGAKPVFVDQDEKTYNIDTGKIEKAVTPKTKAIIPVHLYGQPADMKPIMDIAGKHNLFVIEDCSQAHLSEYNGKRTGGIGHIGTFSFYPGKNLGAYGEGGAVVTNDENLHRKMLNFRQHGSTEKYVHESEGHNYRMEEIQAGVLNVKLKYIREWTEKRRKIAEFYNIKFASFMTEMVIIPNCLENVKHVYHLYVVRVKKRDELMKYLAENGVQSALHYPIPLHLQKAYAYLGYQKGNFPVAENCCGEILSLPMYPELTEEQAGFVCMTIKNFYE